MGNSATTHKVIQITDPHLGREHGDELLGLNTDESLSDVLLALVDGDLVVASGDISNDGSAESYRRFVDTVTTQIHCPLVCLPGNHDDDEVMQRVMGPAVMNRMIIMGKWILIMLNSRVPGFEHGDLTDSELQFLDSILSKHPNYHAMVFLHHQPVPVGSAWIDQYVVRRAEEFFQVIDKHSNVRIISWGHVHQDFHQVRNGVDLYASPSTCVQFKPDCDDFTIDPAMPGYRTFDLLDDGTHSTAIERVMEKTYSIDFASNGY
ncbi:3',5'-cyclic-AMP phosphodiesterase [Marinibactrum halimedae]|uniref:3',5'-cyclic adenosine monophosphate phosphodiesterase CpdA n=1 Tax=Marinibactrum halimedae TaxID=1444977 RepID=A0AA37WNC8_9GAMM|nr:3',5'-cyclic-AMP phosphodiesterase [Marinibactrum halimedae]MCD9457749.1 3',5'-cyclic-AMP phosphodiesterase [Marinibactrum halimedae]GLS24877.1 3',5'-cyclic adenosine monophosphate phosphodiesterase CpdA [Marinibactrum halimedae]